MGFFNHEELYFRAAVSRDLKWLRRLLEYDHTCCARRSGRSLALLGSRRPSRIKPGTATPTRSLLSVADYRRGNP